MKSTVICALVFFGAMAGNAQEVKFCIGEWAPYTGAKLADYGMATEIVTAACQEAGLQASYEFAPWKRAETYVIDGSVFATFPYIDIVERQGKFLFSDELFKSRFAVLTNTANQTAKTVTSTAAESFNGLRVGVTAGTDAVKIPLEKAGAKVEETPTIDASIKKLEMLRLDCIVDDKAVMVDAIKNLYGGAIPAEFKFLDQPFGDATTFKIMASMKYKNSDELIQKIDKGLARIKANGTYAKILAKYGLTP